MTPKTEDILKAATIAFDMTEEEITRHTRKRRYLVPRQLVQYMSRKTTRDTLKRIAEVTGVTNHATILHSSSKIESEAGMYSDVSGDVGRLESALSIMGFDTGRATVKAEANDIYNVKVTYGGRHIPVKVLNRETGESFIANSLRAAARITDINHSAITKECRGMGRTGVLRDKPFKFSYDV